MNDIRRRVEELLLVRQAPSEDLLRSFDRTDGFWDENVVLVGAGRLGKVALGGLRRAGIEPLAFADTDPALLDSHVDGLKVISEGEAANRYGRRAVFVVTFWNAWGRGKLARVRESLRVMGCPRVLSIIELFWKFPDVFLPFFCIDLPDRIRRYSSDILASFDLWADEASRRQYLAELHWRLALDFSCLEGPSPYEQYFPEDLFSLSDSEVFVDCGAYDGDTLRSFLKKRENSFGKIVAIEADPRNFRRLNQWKNSLPQDLADRITLHEIALSSTHGAVNFDAIGTRSSRVCTDSQAMLDAAPLDELLGDLTPTYIKMDIEGSEYEALKGSRQAIANSLPVLAISVYHEPQDMWRIPLFISKMSGDYKLFLRPHKLVCWDLLCYAVPENRIVVK